MQDLVLLGKILSAHGLKGHVKVWSYCELPYNLVSYGALTDKTGKHTFELSLESQTSGGMIASIKGIKSREAAEALRNTELYVSRDKLPETKAGEYYQNDLIGMPVYKTDGSAFGHVGGFHNFGAGVIIEIRLSDSDHTELFAFTEKTFPLVDMNARRITIDPPEEILAEPEKVSQETL
jgi:16S rRNA processing protein RimM